MDIPELIERIKRTHEADRWIDSWIGCLTRRDRSTSYTGSLEASIGLIPEHFSYELTFSAAGAGALRRARLWDWRRSPLACDPGNEWAGEGKTLPLAVCIAALKVIEAHVSLAPPHHGEGNGG